MGKRIAAGGQGIVAPSKPGKRARPCTSALRAVARWLEIEKIGRFSP